MENEYELVPVPVTAIQTRRDGNLHVTFTVDRKYGNFFIWCPKGTHDRKVSGHTITLESDAVVTVSRNEQHPQDSLTVAQMIERYPVKEDL